MIVELTEQVECTVTIPEWFTDDEIIAKLCELMELMGRHVEWWIRHQHLRGMHARIVRNTAAHMVDVEVFSAIYNRGDIFVRLQTRFGLCTDFTNRAIVQVPPIP